MTFVISLGVAVQLERGDYDGALALVGEVASADDGQPFAPETLEEFRRLIRADLCGYYEFSWDTQTRPGEDTYFAVTDDREPIDWTSPGIEALTATWPLADDGPAVTSEPRMLSDFFSARELQRNPWYAEVMRPRGEKYELKLWLPAPSETVRAFVFMRGSDERDFAQRDRDVLTLLRPHLASIRERWERRHRPSALTDREQQIIDLVATGMTNKEIAAELVLSPVTVRKHLENVMAKLGVHTRTAAVAAVRQRS
jgi:DNA-binding CsgD family transcriptional regulator